MSPTEAEPMSPTTRSRKLALSLAACLGLVAGGTVRADTVDVHSTTMLQVREQLRAGGSRTVAPLHEILSISARDIENPVAENLELVLSAWGAASLGDHRVWYDNAPPEHRLFGDLDLAYVQAEFIGRSLQLRLGRQLATGGVTGALQHDGANVLIRLPHGFGVSAYLGSPVSQRFEERGGYGTWNPQRGNLAVGGRAYFTLPRWGEVGLSLASVEDHGDPSRRQAGGDLRLTPIAWLTLLANTNYDFHEERWAETNVAGQFQVLPILLVRADYRHVEPDLFLPRNSILAVFAVDRRNEVGGSFQLDVTRTVALAADYHYLKQQEVAAGFRDDGHRMSGRLTWRPDGVTTVGAEIAKLRSFENGYFQARGFGSRQFGRVLGTLDLQEYAFDDSVNGQKSSFIATGSIGYALGHGFTALVSGSGGATPYYDQRFDLMAKLAYNQSYQLREVR